MKYRQFGNTGIMVSEIGVGCGGLGGDRKQGLGPAILRALDLGVNFFDTCDTYAEGRSEETLGRVFRDVPRDRIVICTKFGGVIDENGWHRDVSVEHLREAFAASCRRLGTDYLDIYMVHTPPKSILTHSDLIAELDKMLASGKIRCYGLSIDNPVPAEEFVLSTGARAIEICFNLFSQAPRKRFLDVARTTGVGVIAKIPIDKGTLSASFDADRRPSDDPHRRRLGDADYLRRLDLCRQVHPILGAGGRTITQGALAWLLSFPELSTAIPGITSLPRIEETAAAGGMRLSDEELKRLDAILGAPQV